MQNGQAATTDISVIENEIAALVAKMKTESGTDTLPSRVGEHTKSILGHCTGVTKEKIAELRKSLDAMEKHILQHEEDLRRRVDHHVAMAEGAASATTVIGDTVKEWQQAMASWR